MSGYRWTEDDLKALETRRQTTPTHRLERPQTAQERRSGRSKYHAEPQIIDGRRFASKKEARRYQELTLLQQVGAIRDLECQPRYELIAANGEIIGHFTPDFRYHSLELGRLIVEDVKGGKATRTEAYMLRKRLFTACYGITLTEV